MEIKSFLFNSKSLSCCFISLFLGILVESCSKNETEIIPLLPDKKDLPASIANCVPGDIKALRAIANANLNEHLFEGDEPGKWKKIDLEWVKREDGKYAVNKLQIKEDAELHGFILNLDGSEKGDIAFSCLQCLDIASAAVKEVTVYNQPVLKTICINGKGKALAENVNIQGGKALKEITVEDMPAVKTLLFGGDAIEKILLADLPNLQDQSNLKFRNGYDTEGNQVEATTVKEFTLKGNLKKLDGLYLRDLGIEKLVLQASLPELKTLTLADNKLSGSFEVKGLEKLQSLFLNKNALLSVNISECPVLTELDVSSNGSLTNCILSLPSLKILDLNGTGVSALDVSKHTNLKKLSAFGSKLTSVVFSNQNNQLDRLNLSNNQLAELVFPPKLTGIFQLTLNHNSLKSLDLSRMNALEVISVNNNEIEILQVPQEAEDCELLECKNNHLTAKQLREIKNILTGLSKWEVAPQYLLGRVDIPKKQMNVTEEIVDLNLVTVVQKSDGKQWKDADSEDFTLEEGVYTIKNKGKFRVICTDLGFQHWKFDVFNKNEPYIIGELEL